MSRLIGMKSVTIAAVALAAGCRYDVPAVRVLDRQDVGPDRKLITYDMTGDGKKDYTQILVDGVVREQRFVRDGHGTAEEVVRSADLDSQTTNHLVLLLDGVPFDLMNEMWDAGYFRMFHRPGRMIGPFPAMTDVSFSQIFQIPPPPGYEAAYFDREKNRLSNGTQVYVSGENEHWVHGVNYRMPFLDDAIMYLYPRHVFREELKRSWAVFDRTRKPHVVLYLLSTDGLCHMQPRDEVKTYLEMLDTWILRIVYQERGRLHVTMFADHGNDFVRCRPAPVEKALKDAGLTLSTSLGKPGQVVVPLFGLINYVAMYTGNAKDQRTAVEAMRRLEAVDVVCYRTHDDGTIVIESGAGRAVIRRREEQTAGQQRIGYKYEPQQGDPLQLGAALAKLQEQRKLDVEGFASADDWTAATVEQIYPDPLRRICECLTDDAGHPSDVIASFREGWYVGDSSLAAWVSMVGTHGALQSSSAMSFIMSSARPSPEYLTPHQVLPWIRSFTPWNPEFPKVKE
jgi:hypothetical protein